MRFRSGTYQLIFSTALILSLMLIGCSTSKEAVFECYSLGQFRKLTSPSFQVYFMNVQAGKHSRIDAYIQMPYSSLRFERSHAGFKASYTISIIVRDENQEIVQTKEVDRTLETKTFEESVSSRNDFFLQSLFIEPKKYRVEVRSADNNSKLRYRTVQSIEALGFMDSSFSASSLLLLDTVLVNNGVLSLRPVLPSSISLLNTSFGLFQEVYNIEKGDSIRTVIEYSMTKYYQEDLSPRRYHGTPPYRINPSSCLYAYDSVYFRHDSVVVANDNGIIRFIQFYPLPSVGGTRLTRKIERIRKGSTVIVEAYQDVYRRSQSSRNALFADEVLNAMKYILKENEYDSLTSTAAAERIKKLNEFWERRGGVQRQAEFEKKIREANSLFTSCIDGARTPMGIVYIVCGSPDYIECKGSYSENWFYNLGDRVMTIQFNSVSERNPQYFEIVPFSVNENLWQYFVERWRSKL